MSVSGPVSAPVGSDVPDPADAAGRAETTDRAHPWAPALRWGFGVALAHRALLGVWMGLVWALLSGYLPIQFASSELADPILPPLNRLQSIVFGVWRRWDATHYLRLARAGYTNPDVGSTVFGPLTPLCIHLLDLILPGPVDLAAMVFATLSFGLALTLLYRVGETYYHDRALGQQAIILTALLPLSFFFSAPMSDALFLALALGLFYAASEGRWWLAACFGFLAALTRNQGVMLLGVGGLILLENQPPSMPWGERLLDGVKRGWPLLFIPLGYGLFVWYRRSLGLPPMIETYGHYSYHFFTDPISGIWANLRWIATHLPGSLLKVDHLALFVTVGLSVLLIADPKHRRPALIAYTLGYLLLFVSKLNWLFETDEVAYSISLARYSLTLFPLTVLVADRLRGASRPLRLAAYTLLFALLLTYSALHALGVGPP